MAPATCVSIPASPRIKRPGTRAAPAALERIGRLASVDEVTRVAQYYPKETVKAALKASSKVVHGGRGMWIAASCTGLPADELEQFVSILGRCTDSDGLVDEHRMTERCAREPWVARVEELAAAMGCARVLGSLCRRDTHLAVAKAGLLHHGGRTTIAAVATAVGRPATAVAEAFSRSRNIFPEGDGVWSVPSPEYLEFAGTLRSHRDWVLVPEDRLATTLGYPQWTEQLEAFAMRAGCVRLFGRLFANGFQDTLICGALIEIGRPASAAEIAAVLNPELSVGRQMSAEGIDWRCKRYSGGLLERDRGGHWWITPHALRRLNADMGMSMARWRSGLGSRRHRAVSRVLRVGIRRVRSAPRGLHVGVSGQLRSSSQRASAASDDLDDLATSSDEPVADLGSTIVNSATDAHSCG